MAPYRQRRGAQSAFQRLKNTVIARVSELDTSFSIAENIAKLQAHKWRREDLVWVIYISNAIFWISLLKMPPFPYKLAIPALYTLAVLIPFTSQFFIPATPVLSWVLCFFASRYMPLEWRPVVSVTTLPALESVLFGGNVSDILTRYTHPVLDVPAWLSYGVLHFTLPIILSISLWLFSPPTTSLKYFAYCFGLMNLTGVWIQNLFPCAAPCKSAVPCDL